MKRRCTLLALLVLNACDGGGKTSPDGGTAGACQAGDVCLDVKPLTTGSAIPAGRLGVLWFQLNDNVTADPLVAYDAAFDPTVTEVGIAPSDLAQPNEANLLCQRACTDGASCPCTGGPRVGLAVVVVLKDLNGNNHIDTAEATEANAYGLGYVVFGYSATDQATLDPPYDYLFPEGIAAGIAPYRIIKNDPGFDGLGKVAPATRFDLNVCAPADAACALPSPNLS